MKVTIQKENVQPAVKSKVNVSKIKREPFKALQVRSDNKDNLVGRAMVYKDIKQQDLELHCKNCSLPFNCKRLEKSIQVGEATICKEDLISEEASGAYWRTVADNHAKALQQSLSKNQQLRELSESLIRENEICKEMLDESRKLVEVLKEIINDPEGERIDQEADNEEPPYAA